MSGPGAYWIGEEEKKEVLDVLNSGCLSRYGDLDDPRFQHKVLSFEREFAQYVGVRHAVATSSGTSGLFISFLVNGLKPGDEVIIPTYGFVATYNAAIFAGLVPVPAEIDDSLTLDPADVQRRITPRTKAIVAIHMLGNPADMDAIQSIADKHGLIVIEDGCQAAGASYRERKVGLFGRTAAFSLNKFKTITAGDGGVFVTDDQRLRDMAFALQDQGYSSAGGGTVSNPNSIVGMNFRMNELTGAVALAQLRKLDRITATLRAKKQRLKQLIGDLQGARYRRLHDAEGECATLCTVIFDTAAQAAAVAHALGTTTVQQSGWHVLANMDQVNNYLKGAGLPHGDGAYPRTDDLLRRSINLSVGVVDAGLGSAFGINIDSSDAQIQQVAATFRAACGIKDDRCRNLRHALQSKL
jgi:dTDP-4-amino-4,6-dideoxygalactose transaminase